MSNWFEQSFGNDYLLVYKHRDHSGAREEVKRMIDWLDLPVGAAVFDLCCGMGRHSIALADFGYQDWICQKYFLQKRGSLTLQRVFVG